jgi:hypothetical protein
MSLGPPGGSTHAGEPDRRRHLMAPVQLLECRGSPTLPWDW